MAEEQEGRDWKSLKRIVLAGAILGALLSLAAAVAMDGLLGNSLQGTWWDASQRDAAKIFGPECGRNPFAPGLLLALVMGLLAALGAFFGGLAAFFLHCLFRFVLR